MTRVELAVKAPSEFLGEWGSRSLHHQSSITSRSVSRLPSCMYGAVLATFRSDGLRLDC